MNVEGAGSIGITALYVNEKPKTGLGIYRKQFMLTDSRGDLLLWVSFTYQVSLIKFLWFSAGVYSKSNETPTDNKIRNINMYPGFDYG